MPNILIPIEIEDIGVDLQTAIAAWDEFYPIPQIEDLENPDKLIPQFPSRAKHIIYILQGELLRKLNWALEQKNKQDKLTLNQDIFASE